MRLIIPLAILLAGSLALAQTAAPVQNLDSAQASADFSEMYTNFVACGGKGSLFKVGFPNDSSGEHLYFRIDQMPTQLCANGKSVFLVDPELFKVVGKMVSEGQPLVFSEKIHPIPAFRAMVVSHETQPQITETIFPHSENRPLMILTPSVFLSGVMHEQVHIHQYESTHPLAHIRSSLLSLVSDVKIANALQTSMMEVFAYKTQDEFVMHYYGEENHEAYEMQDPNPFAKPLEDLTHLGPVLKFIAAGYVDQAEFSIGQAADYYWKASRQVLHTLHDEPQTYCPVLNLIQTELPADDWSYLKSNWGLAVDHQLCSQTAHY